LANLVPNSFNTVSDIPSAFSFSSITYIPDARSAPGLLKSTRPQFRHHWVNVSSEVYVIEEKENAEGISETVLKLFGTKLANCADQIPTEEQPIHTIRLKELQAGLISITDYDKYYGTNGILGPLGTKHDE
jgi:hypothetical protein